MRISLHKDDPWLIKFPSCYRVYFNGRKFNNCIMADEKLGLIEVHSIDSNGDFIIIDNNYIKTDFLVGHVYIKVLFIDMIKEFFNKIRYRTI